MQHLLLRAAIILFVCAGKPVLGQPLQTPATPQLLPNYIVQTRPATPAFTIAEGGTATTICVDLTDWAGVKRAAADLGNDVQKVTGTAALVVSGVRLPKGAIVVGTIGKSPLIDQMIASKKLNVAGVKGQWESFVIQTVDGNLVIAGSDKRGTIYGIYDLSEKIGVSPWYWWADAPPRKSSSLYAKAGRYVQASPKIKYRGIFINDESPSFTGWCRVKFGGVNSKMYTHMFELLLRLKANYLWPAMWSNAFNEDDTASPRLADEYGIVMGTSHHEPMMRAQKEYSKRKQDIGPWDFNTNEAGLRRFWEEGLTRNKNYDNLITMGMRGDGDMAMSKGTDADNMKTLGNVVAAQREIIGKVYNNDPANHPQLWAIFTEVQRYYDAGFTVPSDVIALFCDNNWGYIRRIEPPREKTRTGGSGLYYHIDMNGGPWNDRWVNTTSIPKLREQFNLAYKTGLDALWVVNVGDLKPKELPIDFIMHYAWNPDAYPASSTLDYAVSWATKIFGAEHAGEVADIVSKYGKYNLWRKPEVEVAGLFSVVNHHEADSLMHLWRNLAEKAEALKSKIAPEAQDAYYQLVLYPAKASAGIACMYLTATINAVYAKQGRVSANDYAQQTRQLFITDSLLAKYYNDTMGNGRWKNMMSDVHMGYTKWSMPARNEMPEVVEVAPLPNPTMGVAVEGSEAAWPGATKGAALPAFDGLKKSAYYIDVFNRGTGRFAFEAAADKPWIKVSTPNGTVEKEERLLVSIDWNKAPTGTAEGTITLKSGDISVPVLVKAVNAAVPTSSKPFFGSLTGEFSIPAHQYATSVAGQNARWVLLPNLGRAEGCMGISPVSAPSATPQTAPRLEYNLWLADTGNTTVLLGILPTQDVYPQRGLRIGVSIDGGAVQVLDARQGLVDIFSEYTEKNLAASQVLKPLPPQNKTIALNGVGRTRRNEIFDNLRWLDVQLPVAAPGMHTLKVYMIDPELVLEKIVVNPDNDHPSYFGAPAVQYGVKR